MKYVLALIASLFLISPVLADQTTINTQGKLTEEQQTALAAEAAKMVAQNASGAITPTKAKEFQQWVDLGTAIGSGLASTARELGVAANDFVKTPVGKLTAGLIVWHFIGGTIIHITFGLTWLLIVGTFLYSLYRRQAFKVTTTDYDKNDKGVKRTVVREPIRLTDGQNGFFIVASLLTVAIGCISIATF